jgi:8-oxo-dGTP pyrophosphatase MutT (NUDIX family)
MGQTRVPVAAEQLILVDAEDRELGVGDKLQAHLTGTLHRAFSMFVFDNQKQLLIQKRALTKYHSGGLWSNTVCGHPRPGENTIDAAHRRLKEEMGFDCELEQKRTPIIFQPIAPPVLAGHELQGISFPCYEIGGDYYDFILRKDGRLVIALGDVSGKGIAAVLLMSSLHAAMRRPEHTTRWQQLSPPPSLLRGFWRR